MSRRHRRDDDGVSLDVGEVRGPETVMVAVPLFRVGPMVIMGPGVRFLAHVLWERRPSCAGHSALDACMRLFAVQGRRWRVRYYRERVQRWKRRAGLSGPRPC